MKALRRFFIRIFNSGKMREHEQRIREEIEEHIALATEENLHEGMSPVEARRQAMLKFGAMEAIKENYHAERAMQFLETLIHDVRYARRVLHKSPGFSIAAILTLAMAIGANAVVFGVLNAVILHPLKIPQSEDLYAVQHGNEASSYISYPDYLDLRDRNRSFDGMAGYNVAGASLNTGKNPSRVWIIEASGNYFDELRLQPYLGRFFHASDEHGANSAPWVVLTYTFWHTHFQDDPGVVGRTVQVNKHPFTIIGVAPPEFHGTLMFFNPDFFVPLVNQEQIDGDNYLSDRKKDFVFMSMGHLKPGVTPAQAVADLNAIGAWLGSTYPRDSSHRSFVLARPSLYGDYLGRPVKAFIAGLMLLASLILLAACANLGSLFAARAADRSREVALRLAIGSSRTRILRQLFTEAVLISLVGGAVGLWGSILLLQGLSSWQPFSKWPIQVSVSADTNVFAVALLLAVVSGLLFGAVPVRQVLRTDPYEIIKLGPTGSVEGRVNVRDLLLVVQIAICAVLITSSLVAVSGLVRSLNGRLGFEPQNAILADTDLAMAGYSHDQMPAMQKRMLDSVKAIPAVESAALANGLPLDEDAGGSLVFSDTTTDLRSAKAVAEPNTYSVSPEYFGTAGTALLAGRTFTWHDDKSVPRVAVVNLELARRLFGSKSAAIGRYFKIPDGTRVQVVGVVEQGKYGSLTEDPQPVMFSPLLQAPASRTFLVVRSSRDPQLLQPIIRDTLHGLDSALPVYIETWYKDLDTVLFGPRMATLSLGVLGIMGAMLAITGIFGMAAYSVSKRLRELGIRVALGAERKEILQAALGRAVKLLAFGSVSGLVLGILASRVLSFIVYQATPRDPLILAGVVFAMALLGLVATWIPARRALKVDPLILLRAE